MVKSTQQRLLGRLALMATILALIVVMLGAYTRLRDAGLGCPDWPGCYGQLHVPQTAEQIHKAAIAFPQQPVVAAKAWPEMVHRYVAGTLALLIFAISFLAIKQRQLSKRPLISSVALVGLVVFQALLGMWTVTMLLYPPVVMGHLVAGMTILATLCWVSLSMGGYFREIDLNSVKRIRPWALLALIIVGTQIALGGWTSANYAGLACPDFPTCQGQWLPTMDMQKGFDFWMPVGANFQGGLLDSTARVAIHVTHRFGALITFLYVASFAIWLLIMAKTPLLRRIAAIMGALLLLQILLGIILVVAQFPLFIAVAHNGVAALLLLSVIALNCSLYPLMMRNVLTTSYQA